MANGFDAEPVETIQTDYVNYEINKRAKRIGRNSDNNDICS